MRADRNDLRDFRLLQRFQILFGELLEHQIVAQPPRRIAGASFLFQHAERGSQMLHHARERRNNLAALRIVRAHAAEPQAIFLRAVEDREIAASEMNLSRSVALKPSALPLRSSARNSLVP